MFTLRKSNPFLKVFITTLFILAACLAVSIHSAQAASESAKPDCKSQGAFVKAPTVGAMFNNPGGTKAQQLRIVHEFDDNVRGAKPGSTVRVATLAINLKDTTDAMLKAYKCGVNMQVVVPRAQWEMGQIKRLRKNLGENVNKSSFITNCSRSCFFAKGGRTMHAKISLFSDTNKASNVTMFTSSNLDKLQTQMAYNDAYQLVGNDDVYNQGVAYFDLMKYDKDNKFKSVYKFDDNWLFFFPTNKKAPLNKDYHMTILNNVKCKTSSGRTLIEMNIAIANRKDIARKLVSLHKQGCKVRVNMHLLRVSKNLVRILYEGGVPTHVQLRTDGDLSVHSKSLIISGNHYGKNVKTVYTGSTNLTGESTIGDNNNIRIVNNATAWQAFHNNFQAIWDYGRPLSKKDVTRAKTTIDIAKAEAED